jgi:hypothetical protein
MSHYLLKDRNLIALVRPRDGVGLATVIGVCTCDDSKNRIIIGLCVFQPLEND